MIWPFFLFITCASFFSILNLPKFCLEKPIKAQETFSLCIFWMCWCIAFNNGTKIRLTKKCILVPKNLFFIFCFNPALTEAWFRFFFKQKNVLCLSLLLINERKLFYGSIDKNFTCYAFCALILCDDHHHWIMNEHQQCKNNALKSQMASNHRKNRN